jgi:hypothetical protein
MFCPGQSDRATVTDLFALFQSSLTRFGDLASRRRQQDGYLFGYGADPGPGIGFGV